MRTKHLIPNIPSLEERLITPSHPDNVMLDVTGVCNHRCSFCYQSGHKIRHHASLAHLLALVGSLSEWGVSEILYLGGEPTLFPGLLDLLRHGHANGMKQRLITNGSGLHDNSFFKTLQELTVEIGVSFHGGEPEAHDAVTHVSGSFAKSINTLKKLDNAGIPWWIQYSHTRRTVTGLIGLYQILKQQELYPIFFDVNRLVKRNKEKYDEDIPDEDNWWQFLSQFPYFMDSGLSLRIEAHPHCWIMRRAKDSGWSDSKLKQLLSCVRPCWMGFAQWAFSETGQPKSCPTLEPDTTQPYMPPTVSALRQRWQDDPALQARRIFHFLHSACLTKNTIQQCEFFYQCLGGCRVAENNFCSADPLIFC